MSLETAAAARARRIPLWRWTAWWTLLGAALVVFYVLAAPIWFGLRAAAWLAEFQARRRHCRGRAV